VLTPGFHTIDAAWASAAKVGTNFRNIKLTLNVEKQNFTTFCTFLKYHYEFITFHIVKLRQNFVFTLPTRRKRAFRVPGCTITEHIFWPGPPCQPRAVSLKASIVYKLNSSPRCNPLQRSQNSSVECEIPVTTLRKKLHGKMHFKIFFKHDN
jgi:hypothetical protein